MPKLAKMVRNFCARDYLSDAERLATNIGGLSDDRKMLLTLASAAVCVIWVLLLVARGGFWRMGAFVTRPRPGNRSLAGVAVVIPARDEAASIEAVIRSWAAHKYEGPLRVILVDDQSSDGTPEIARSVIAGSPRFELIQAPDRPRGWTGKLWAVSRGVEAARSFEPDFILFTDADIVHSPDTLQALVEKAEGDGFDLVSLMVRLHCSTPAERALIPAFVFFFFLLYPPAWIADPDSKIAGAAGGCMLVRRRTLEQAGGIESINGELIDDCALASAIKRAGGRVFLAPAESSESLRVYGTLGEAGNMIARSAYTQLHYSVWLLAGTLAGLFITYLLPVGLAIFAHGPARIGGIAAWVTMAITFRPVNRYYRQSWAWWFALPAIAAFYGGATLYSAVRYWQGRGGEWKGRTQAT